MRNETVHTEITVIGGGLAGVSAAIAAARMGKKVSFVQNRPVLGGNSSSEIRVWVCGATKFGTQRFARETGIIGELLLENQYRNPDGNPYIWDTVILDKVRGEENINLFLNTDVTEVVAEGDKDDRKITSVTGWMTGSERRIRFESQIYIDCTGDGLIGFLAGADFVIGRESREQYQEDWAPEIADNITLGSSILFYTKDTGQPVKYIPPNFAKDILKTPIPINRVIRSGDSGAHYWWIEWGSEHDTIHDNELIRDELWSVIYGIWDYIKNSGNFDAENLTLEWVGNIPGKREHRRFIGDYVLNQNDILNQENFEDNIGFGGWSIDLHSTKGMYSEDRGAKHIFPDGTYPLPYRTIYSRNTSNLFFAGRNISASHVAFGSTRVMGTCAVLGEAAGTGAAICVDKSITPREIFQHYLTELQQALLKNDASIVGITNKDKNDLAQSATINASSYLKNLAIDKEEEPFHLANDIGLLLPVDTNLGKIEFLLDVKDATELTVEVWSTGKLQNYIPAYLQKQIVVPVSKGEKQWVSVDLDYTVTSPENAFIVIKANESLTTYVSNQMIMGVLSFLNDPKLITSLELGNKPREQKVYQWTMKPFNRKTFCFKLASETMAYAPEKVIDGHLRPYGGPHLWSSEPLVDGTNEWIELSWEQFTDINEVHLIFNDNVNEDLNNLHHHRTPYDIMPDLVKSYLIEAQINGSWQTIIEEKENRVRKRIHTLDTSIETKKIRLVVEATNGCSRAEVFEIRVY